MVVCNTFAQCTAVAFNPCLANSATTWFALLGRGEHQRRGSQSGQGKRLPQRAMSIRQLAWGTELFWPLLLTEEFVTQSPVYRDFQLCVPLWERL
jgi:hypothetical protein